MICEKCGANEATVLIEQTINGKHTKYHLCPGCAAGVKMDDVFGDLSNLFGNLFFIGEEEKSKPKLQCPSCGITYESFKKTGRLGCANCYEAFNKELQGVFESIQPGTHHKGKLPKRSKGKILNIRAIEEYKTQIKKAIESEEYEKAAHLRDLIKELESAKKEGE